MTTHDHGYPYVWAWDKWPRSSWTPGPGGYKGMPCRCLATGKKNAALVEFATGERFITSRRGLRRRKGTDRG